MESEAMLRAVRYITEAWISSHKTPPSKDEVYEFVSGLKRRLYGKESIIDSVPMPKKARITFADTL